MSATPTTSAAQEQLVRARVAELLAAHPPASTPVAEFLGARFDAGVAWVHFPEGCGGLGVAPAVQAVVEAELRGAGAPAGDVERRVIGLGMAAPTIVAHGTEEQRRRFLRPLYTGEEIWCQLFSEPGAGSDVASLATRAVRDGDEWVLNGQKVWTTLAHIARWGLLLARSDPSVPKHQGLTYFVLDMQAPGVEVRPLRQITGEAEFNEVFLTDARVPDAHRLGGVGEGWRVALTTLMNERVAIGEGLPAARGAGPIGVAARLWRERGGDPARLDRLMQLWVAAEVNRLTIQRARERRTTGTPGPEGSVAKLVFAELNQRIWEACVDLLGADGMLYPGGYEFRRADGAALDERRDPRWMYLRSRANSIEGGTSEVMRNILGERVLGLPGEPRLDKDQPWSEVPRSV